MRRQDIEKTSDQVAREWLEMLDLFTMVRAQATSHDPLSGQVSDWYMRRSSWSAHHLDDGA